MPRPVRRRRSVWPWVAALVPVLGVVAWIATREVPALRERFGSASRPVEPADATPAPPRTVPPAETSAERPGLPSLGESDPLVREAVRNASPSPTLGVWLGYGTIVQRFVAAVDAIADGETPRTQVPFLAPDGRFAVRDADGRTFVDPASWARYDAVADVIASLDAKVCATVYRSLKPLLEQAYAELGRPDRTFEGALTQAVDRLLATPDPGDRVELVPLVTVYEYADPRLEALTRAEKHLLRMGPRNERLVQAKLREIETALRAVD